MSAGVPRAWLLTLAALSALATLSTNILLPSLPAMARELNVGDAGMTAVLSLFLAVFAGAQLIVGPLSDRIGRRPVVLGGLAAFIAGTLLCAAATDLVLLLGGRAVQAASVAAASVLARAAARDRFEGPQLAGLLGSIMVVMAAAPGFSPLLGGLVQQAFGWRAVFGVLLVASLAVGLAYVRIVGETLPPALRRRQPIGALALGYVALSRDGRFMRPALAVAAIMGALFAFFAATPVVLGRDFGLSALQVGGFFAATVLIVFAAGRLAPRWALRLGSAAVLRRAVWLAALGGLLMFAAGTLGLGLGLAGFAVPVCVFLLGMGLAMPVGTAAALTPFAAQAGQASALLGFLQMAAAAVGTSVVASLPMPRATALAVVMVGAAVIAAFSMRRAAHASAVVAATR
jgi:DHA1 family bicyclomycin/chloramphenicol resistance-like MFS transporter